MKAFIKFIFSLYLVLGTVAYLMSCLAPFINPVHSSILYFSGLAFPIILINFIFVAFYMGIIKKKFVFLFLLIPGIIFGLNYISLGLTSDADLNEGLNIYTLNTFSTKLLHENEDSYKAWNDYSNAIENQADVICVQEFSHDISTLFPSAKKYHIYSKKKSNLKIASRHPIMAGGELKDDTGLRFAIYADIIAAQDTVRVYNFHLYSNKISEWLKTAEKTENPDAKKIIRGGERLQQRIYKAASNRAIQAKKLKWHIEASPYKVIACGDMNETPQSFSYRQLKGRLNDTFRTGSTGSHPTYRKNPSWVRIDYIFADTEFDVMSYQVLPYEISDHRVVKAVLRK